MNKLVKTSMWKRVFSRTLSELVFLIIVIDVLLCGVIKWKETWFDDLILALL